ncbi:MAG: hypothetical protein WA810_04025 [Maribacter sp.]
MRLIAKIANTGLDTKPDKKCKSDYLQQEKRPNQGVPAADIDTPLSPVDNK